MQLEAQKKAPTNLKKITWLNDQDTSLQSNPAVVDWNKVMIVSPGIMTCEVRGLPCPCVHLKHQKKT